LTIGYPIGYTDHHTPTLRDRPDQRRMGNPPTRSQTRPLRRQNQNTRTSQTLPLARNHERHPLCPHNRLPVATTPQRPAPVEDRLRPLSAVAKARCACPDPRRAGLQGAGAGGQSGAQAFSGGQSACAVHRKGGARGYDGGKKVNGRKRHLVVDSQGSVLGVWVSPADVSDARGARVVLEQVLRRYPSAQIVIADGAYDKEGLLEWLLSEFCVALECVFRAGKVFVVLPRCWLVARSFAWLLGCRRLSRCYDGLCEVEACWMEWACVRWLVRRMAGEKKC
jgi:putative transposase